MIDKFDMKKFFEEQSKFEKERIERLQEQLKKGCGNCSQWDSYWGCSKCESLFN